jgi:uncharacterized protein
VSAAGRRGFRIGLIADTHGLLRPAALDALSGCDRILHGGDIGGAGILAELKRIAPLTAVRGNNDREPWAAQLPERTVVRVGALAILLLHDAATLGAAVPDVQVVVCGHSHRPSVAERDGVLFVNPGSAGPRRFRLPVSVAELWIEAGRAQARLIELAA